MEKDNILRKNAEICKTFNYYFDNIRQKQPPRGVPRKRCFENMQQINMENTHVEVLFVKCKATLLKLHCNFIEITLRYGCSSVYLLHIFIIPFFKNTSGRLLLIRDILDIYIWGDNFSYYSKLTSRNSVFNNHPSIRIIRININNLLNLNLNLCPQIEFENVSMESIASKIQ